MSTANSSSTSKHWSMIVDAWRSNSLKEIVPWLTWEYERRHLAISDRLTKADHKSQSRRASAVPRISLGHSFDFLFRPDYNLDRNDLLFLQSILGQRLDVLREEYPAPETKTNVRYFNWHHFYRHSPIFVHFFFWVLVLNCSTIFNQIFHKVYSFLEDSIDQC